MSASVTQNRRSERGRFAERPLVLAEAEPVMNAQCVLAEVAERLAKDARLLYDHKFYERAAENSSFVLRISKVLAQLREAIV